MSKPYIFVLRQLGGIGDVIALSCVARGLKEKYPKHRLIYGTARIYLGGALEDIATHNPLWDEVHIFEPFDATDLRTRQVWNKYYSTAPAIEDDLMWQKAGLTVPLNTACVEYEWEAMNAPDNIQKPRYQIWCDSAGVVPTSYAPIYRITHEEQKRADALLKEAGLLGKHVVGVGITACDTKRAIGVGKLQAICQGLKDAGCVPVTIDPTFKFEDGTPYLINKRVAELMPIIKRLSAVISVDSGLLHMAGAVGTPTVGIFGPTDPDMRMRLYKGSAIDGRKLVGCSPCWYKYPCVGGSAPFLCLSRIAPEVIVEETLRWVNNSQ